MNVAIASDHAGYHLKENLITFLENHGENVLDLGTDSTDSVDYPDFAEALGKAILKDRAERGILICGSGVGASIAANKMDGIRAGLCHDVYSAGQSVEHDDANILVLGARVIGSKLARKLVETFLNAEFSNEERHVRRLNKIKKLEENN